MAIGAFLVLGSAQAEAYVPIDPFGFCILRAQLPNNTSPPPGNGGYSYQGEVDCGQYEVYETALNVCSQVQNGSSWYTVSGSCTGIVYNGYWVSSETLTPTESGVCGHVYRTWDQGWVYISPSWDTNTYNSSAWSDCSYGT